MQLVFIDKTTLDIGPNSSIVIDKFVFDPAAAKGEMAVSLGKGVLRVVGGQATHTGGATVTTPFATIGLRGGILTVSQSDKEGTQALLGYGVMTMSSGGVTETVTRTGFAIRAISAFTPPSPAFKASAALINAYNASMTSKNGQSGGSNVKPSDQQAAANNIGTANSFAALLQSWDWSSLALDNFLNEIVQNFAKTGQIPPRSQIVVAASPPPPHRLRRLRRLHLRLHRRHPRPRLRRRRRRPHRLTTCGITTTTGIAITIMRGWTGMISICGVFIRREIAMIHALRQSPHLITSACMNGVKRTGMSVGRKSRRRRIRSTRSPCHPTR